MPKFVTACRVFGAGTRIFLRRYFSQHGASPLYCRLLRETGLWRFPVKKILGLFALIGAAVGALMFWRRRQDNDEFLDEELE